MNNRLTKQQVIFATHGSYHDSGIEMFTNPLKGTMGNAKQSKHTEFKWNGRYVSGIVWYTYI